MDAAGRPLRARCVYDPASNVYVVQGRTARGWTDPIGTGASPMTLLQTVVVSKGVGRVMSSVQGAVGC